jgi:hypothetical protein
MMVASPNCEYIVVITDFYDPPVEAVRAFRCAPDAREWLWNYHGELYTKNPDNGGIERARLYKIAVDGSCVEVDSFSGEADDEGFAEGWVNSCQWHTSGHEFRCDNTAIKDTEVCSYHKRYPQFIASPGIRADELLSDAY